jgi:hypothetical protein
VPLTADRAEITGARFFEQGLGQRLPGDPLDVLVAVDAVLEVLVGEHGDEVDQLDEAGRAQVAEQALRDRRLFHEVEGLVEAGLVFVPVGDDDLFLAPDPDGLELLAAPDGTGAAPPIDTVPVVGDGCEPDEVLPRGPDAQGPGRVPRLGNRDQGVVCFVGRLAPKVARRQDLGLAWGDVDHHRCRGRAFDDEDVEARGLETRAPGPAGIRRAQDAGERGLEGHVAAAGRRRVGTDERRSGDDERVVGAERVAGRVDRIVEDAGRHPPAAQVIKGQAGVERQGPHLSPAEVGDEDPAVVSGDGELRHVRPLRYQNSI